MRVPQGEEFEAVPSAGCSYYLLHWCVSLRFTGNSKGLRMGFEMGYVRQVVALERRAYLGFRKTIRFPCAIEMLEAFSDEPLLRYVPEDEVGFTDRAVLMEVPGFTDGEITQQIVGGIRFERHGHQRMKQFAGFGEMRIDPRQIEKAKFPQFSK